MTDNERMHRRVAAALKRMGTDVFGLPDDERTEAGAREMAELLTQVAGLPVDPAVGPQLKEPGELSDVD